MHDSCIVSYKIDFKNHCIEMIIYDEQEERTYKCEWFDVLTHSFDCILKFNQILDICVCGIENFFSDNEEEILRLRDYCWPINYQNVGSLKEYLINNGYKYIKLYSSLGLTGWVLSKAFNVTRQT